MTTEYEDSERGRSMLILTPHCAQLNTSLSLLFFVPRPFLGQASTLIGGLAGERTRWTEDSEKSADLKRRLVGDCALGSAFVSYCGPFNQEFRRFMVTEKFTADLQVYG